MTAKKEVLSIPPIRKERITVKIVGISPLLTNRFSDEQKGKIRDKQQKKASTPLKAKDPEACYQASIYRTTDGRPGFPANGIKLACVDACSFLPKFKTWARGAFFVEGNILPIEGDAPRLREDITKLRGSTADLRYRAEFVNWSITFTVLYNASVISPEEILNLIENAGFSIGIGDWRPQTNGNLGMFEVERE